VVIEMRRSLARRIAARTRKEGTQDCYTRTDPLPPYVADSLLSSIL